MPTRLIREGILSSEAVCSLNWAAEVFYRRLMSVVDDYGRFSSLPKLLRSACYPLQIDKVSDSDIEKWLSACETAALVRVYWAADQKRYLEVLKFGQAQRSKSKCPEPLTQEGNFQSKECNFSYLQTPENNCLQLKTDENNCLQPLANVHLGGGGGGVVFEDGDVDDIPPSRASAREGPTLDAMEPFVMSVDWQPSQQIATIAKMSGIALPASSEFSAAIGEFVAYWLTQQHRARTGHEWDHAFIKSLKADRIREQSRGQQPTKPKTKIMRGSHDQHSVEEPA